MNMPADTLQALTPAFLSSSATAAALLFTVLAFLYNIVERLRENDDEANRIYLETRWKTQREVRFKTSGCIATTQGNAGVRGKIDYEWTTDMYYPVTQQQAYPDSLKFTLPGLMRPFLGIVLQESIQLQSVLDFEDENIIDQLISKSLSRDCHMEIRTVFVQNPNSPLGTSFLQFAFLTRLPSIMQSIIKFMQVISIAIVVFIGVLVCFVFASSAPVLSSVGTIAYFIGWATIVYGVKIILSILPIVKRREKLSGLTFGLSP